MISERLKNPLFFFLNNIYIMSNLLNTNVKILNSETAVNFHNRCVVNRDNSIIEIFENVHLNFKNYDNTHFLKNYDTHQPNYKTLSNFLSSAKQYTSNGINMLLINEAVFFYTMASFHVHNHHIWFDFYPHFNAYFNLLINNPKTVIVLEIIGCNPTSVVSANQPVNKVNLIQIVNFMIQCGIKNDIIIISNEIKNINKLIYNKETNNYITNTLMGDVPHAAAHINGWIIKKLHVVKYSTNIFDAFASCSRHVKNMKGDYFSDTIRKILISNNTSMLQVLPAQSLILEKRIINIHSRGISMQQYLNIKKICIDYCNKNNLLFIEWSPKADDIISQINVTMTAKIIIGFGGSFWLYNMINNARKLILNAWPEHGDGGDFTLPATEWYESNTSNFMLNVFLACYFPSFNILHDTYIQLNNVLSLDNTELVCSFLNNTIDNSKCKNLSYLIKNK